jgi:NRPS condensation-like uncharacterized protein
MKDEFTDGNIYYTQNPIKLNEIVLAKASYEDGIKFLNFFSCDCSLKIKWIEVDMAIDFRKYLKV